jgi:hypothetical protein
VTIDSEGTMALSCSATSRLNLLQIIATALSPWPSMMSWQTVATAMAGWTAAMQYSRHSPSGKIRITMLFLNQLSCTPYLLSTSLHSISTTKTRSGLTSSATSSSIARRCTTGEARTLAAGPGMYSSSAGDGGAILSSESCCYSILFQCCL